MSERKFLVVPLKEHDSVFEARVIQGKLYVQQNKDINLARVELIERRGK